MLLIVLEPFTQKPLHALVCELLGYSVKNVIGHHSSIIHAHVMTCIILLYICYTVLYDMCGSVCMRECQFTHNKCNYSLVTGAPEKLCFSYYHHNFRLMQLSTCMSTKYVTSLMHGTQTKH